MHTIALVLAAEKSKVPFYVAGGVLIVWALTLSLGIGMRRPGFPGSVAGQRAIMAVSAVLVIAALITAVLTSGVPAKGPVPPAHTETLPPVPVESAPASSSSADAASPTSAASSTSAASPTSAASATSTAAEAKAATRRHTTGKARKSSKKAR